MKHSIAKDRTAVLQSYPKAVVHLRQQYQTRRFGLVLGSGISVDFKVPMWPSLVSKIADDPQVDGKALLLGHVDKKSLPFKTEMLFHRFREKFSKVETTFSELDQQNIIKARWLEICATHIYSEVDSNLETALKAHPYFSSLLPLVQQSYLTINFNFDDFLERALALCKREKDKTNKGFEVVTDPWPQFRRSDSVIYHPHGIVPFQHKLMELPVDRFVFSEAAYSTQYVGSRGHDSSFLLSHFARNTCLLLGCALEDELRNVLMRSAQINPGNYHYYVQFIEDESSQPTEEQRLLISETNFNVYNLITLFLTPQKIKALLDIINQDEVSNKSLNDLAIQSGVQLNYNYYLTGPIGVGKSTTASLLRSLHVLDEWLETRPSILAKPWDELTPEEAQEADDWIIDQFCAKNETLRHLEPAVSIVDRPPLDPLSFTKKEDRPKKAKILIDRLCPGRKWAVESGVVILLTGDPEVLSSRVRATGRDNYSVERLEKLQKDIVELYKGAGVYKVDTKNLSILEVTKRVAEIIHRKKYEPFDLDGQLKLQEGII